MIAVLTMDIRGKQPSTWDAYEGVSRTSVDSDTESHVQWDELERRPSGASNAGTGRWSGTVGELRRRRCVHMQTDFTAVETQHRTLTTTPDLL